VLEPKPDLVTVEFVNDAYLEGDALREQYTEIVDRISECGAETILIAPHLVRPDWMGMNTMKFDEDPRPYVRDLKALARERRIALADAVRPVVRLWRVGIPYVIFLADSINHPDERGHQLFAEAPMSVFP